MSVRAFITAMTFPDDYEVLVDMLDRNRGLYDLGLVFERARLKRTVSWSSPRWARPGDVAFFYCTKNWMEKIRRLKADTLDNADWRIGGKRAPTSEHKALLSALRDAEEIQNDYGGTIFAVGQVKGSAERDTGDPEFWLANQWFSEIGKLSSARIVESARIAEHVKLTPRGTVTLVPAAAARAFLKEMFGALPPKWLRQTVFWDQHSLKKLREEWTAFVASEHFRPINEAELREQFVDHVTNLLSSSKVWHECRCLAGGRALGIADYVIELHGKLVVVETKLQITNSVELEQAVDQVRRYMGAEKFVPQVGRARTEKIQGTMHDRALLIDLSGIYVIEGIEGRDAKFNCPDWPRHTLRKGRKSALANSIAGRLGLS